MVQPVGIGLLGLGTVGSGAVRILQSHAHALAAKAGAPLILRKIAVRDLSRPRDVDVDRQLLTANPAEVVRAPDVDVVVETMGGVDPAKALIAEALQRGKDVVTANKEVIARHGVELLALAHRSGARLYYEASVAGGIPIIRPLQACLAANRIETVIGIINGTTNYVLTRMSQEGVDLEHALRDAQALGYAEADPTSDVDGHDAAYKIAILARLAFGADVDVDRVHREGIRRITPDDLRYGQQLGYALKLLAIAQETSAGLDVRVHPTFLAASHPLAAVHDAFNGIFVTGDAVGELMFYGQGAGAAPTGSAVVADVVDAVRQRQGGGPPVAPVAREAVLIPVEDTFSPYYVSLGVTDKPGVLGRVASAFGDAGVSLDRVIQKGTDNGGDSRPVRLVVVTHRARHAQLRRALETIERFDVVHGDAHVIRVMEERP